MNRQMALAQLFLLPNAPTDVITAVFRVLAKKYHPDMGGSTEQMQRLNAAMEVIK
jgi:curved DNA-binding protein CbpA